MRFPADDYEVRAVKAYFRSGATQQPCCGASETVTLYGRKYVVLRNIRGPLKVYRVENDGKLRSIQFRSSEWEAPVIARIIKQQEEQQGRARTIAPKPPTPNDCVNIFGRIEERPLGPNDKFKTVAELLAPVAVAANEEVKMFGRV